MSIYRHIVRPCLFALSPETGHDFAIGALSRSPLTSFARLSDTRTTVAGVEFPNAVGLGAGFDKNARALSGLYGLGFGFVEAGTVTLRSQSGNTKPRLFRLKEDEGIINRMGFNNDGVEKFITNVSAFRKKHRKAPPLGINVGLNKNRVDRPEDYAEIIGRVYALADYITVNISSPNTPGLRDLQQADNIKNLLKHISDAKKNGQDATGRNAPIFVKIAPDMEEDALKQLAELFILHDADGVILGNTTLSRPVELQSVYKDESGGLSGKPLKALALQKLKTLYKAGGIDLPIIACGGISCGAEAFERIAYGASAVQIYSAMIYDGPGAAKRIERELAERLHYHQFDSISAACGSAT